MQSKLSACGAFVCRCPARGKISHGEPTWFVGKKVFAMFSNNHHGDGHVAVTVPAAIGIQEMLIKKWPLKFYRPPYVGVRGWVGIEVDRISDKNWRSTCTKRGN